MVSPETERLHVAIRLAETGIALHRQSIRRRHPGLSEAQVDQRLAEWLLDRPLDVSAT